MSRTQAVCLAVVAGVLIVALAVGVSFAHHRSEISYRYCLGQGNAPAECKLARA